MSSGDHGPGSADSLRSETVPHRWIWWDAVFILCALIAATVRFVILRQGGAPPTIDAGNWLAFGDTMLGDGVRSSTMVYPPLVPLLTKASVALFGLTGGVATLAAALSLAPAAGVYIALRYSGLAGVSLVPALLVLGASSVGEATAWGGFPQLIGLGLTPVTLVLFDRFLTTWSIRHALASGVAVMSVLATSHFVGAALVVAAATLLVLGLRRPVDPVPNGWQRAGRLGLVLLPSAWLAPLYWSLTRAYGGDSATVASPNQLTWSNLFERVEFLYRDTPWLWRFLLPLAIAAPFLLWRYHRTALWRAVSALLATTVLLIAVTREDRFLYFLTTVTALGLALWMVRGLESLRGGSSDAAPSGRRTRAIAVFGVGILVAAIGFQAVRSTEFFRSQREYYGILTPGLVSGIEYLRESSAPDAVVAVPSLNNAPLGWWVEAIAKRTTVYGSPLGWLSFDDEIRRAAFANDLFAPPFPTEEKVELAKSAGIELILVPATWFFFDDAAIDALAGAAPDAVLRLNDDAVVIVVAEWEPPST